MLYTWWYICFLIGTIYFEYVLWKYKEKPVHANNQDMDINKDTRKTWYYKNQDMEGLVNNPVGIVVEN